MATPTTPERIPIETAAERVDRGEAILHALVEEGGEPVTLIRDIETGRVFQVDGSLDDPPGPWPDA